MRFKTLTWRRDWGPAAAAATAVLVGSMFALSRKSSAAHGVRQTDTLTSDLLEQTQQASSSLLSPAELTRLEGMRGAFQERIDDSKEAGRVVPELTESARKAGLIVREIQPALRASIGGPGKPGNSSATFYRVLVSGAYRQIAEYMELCKGQRVPARVAGLRVSAADPEDPTARAGDLVAELTMEVFHPELAADANTMGGAPLP